MIKEFLENHGEYYDDKYFNSLTTLKMGGHIKHLVYPNTFEDVKEIVRFLKNNKIAFKLLGNGSNLICGESEFDGVVLCLKHIDGYEINNNQLYCEAGVLAPKMANFLAKQDYSCLEFASGIPGTIGGLVYMNAGAYNDSISEVLEEVLVLKDDEFVWMNNEECKFKYRRSIFQEHPHWIVLAAKFRLKRRPCEEIIELMQDRLTRRKATQPLDMPSAGSCFRNPDDGNYAWKLIDGIGYRGFNKNGVMVSEKHSNFIVNTGNGTAQDYLDIVYQIQDKVKEKYDIKLVMEVEKFNC